MQLSTLKLPHNKALKFVPALRGTIGFKALASTTGLMEKSLMRMLSAKGNPRAKNLFNIIHALQQLNEVNLVITASPGAKSLG